LVSTDEISSALSPNSSSMPSLPANRASARACSVGSSSIVMQRSTTSRQCRLAVKRSGLDEDLDARAPRPIGEMLPFLPIRQGRDGMTVDGVLDAAAVAEPGS
jgi:hypothetical protein